MKQSLVLLICLMAVVSCQYNYTNSTNSTNSINSTNSTNGTNSTNYINYATANNYILGAVGQSCNQACFSQGMNCNSRLVLDDNIDLYDVFVDLGVDCDYDSRNWWAEDQPSFASVYGDKNYGRCLGFTNVPAGIECGGSYPTTQRLCRCDPPSKSHPTFGIGYSDGSILTTEKWVFEHVLAPGDVGVLTHLATSYNSSMDNGVVIRYYIDGEQNASIQFTPSMACGVGFYDAQGPWGTEWIGKTANDSGWYNNFRVPFQKSIVVTTQHLYANYYNSFDIIIRGSLNLPIIVGGETLPSNARLNQNVINSTFQPMQFVQLVNVSSGPGAHWMTTIATSSGNLNFLEGCFHAYFDSDDEFPGVVLSTGTDNYFDSASYFSAGEFHLENSGFTHLTQASNNVTWSAYRFHDNDPLFFDDGFQLIWRIGDMLNPSHTKCQTQSGGTIVGNTTVSQVFAYAWTYTWPEAA